MPSIKHLSPLLTYCTYIISLSYFLFKSFPNHILTCSVPSFLCHFEENNHVGDFPTRALPSVPVHIFSVQATFQQDRQLTAETCGRVRSNQNVEGRKVSRKDFHRSVDRCLKVVQARIGTEFWAITLQTSMAAPPPAVGLCVGRYNRFNECLTSEAYIDSVLVQKVLQFNFHAQQPLRIPASQRRFLPTSSS